ncbi:electron transport complex subunit RsxD [Natronospirillum operosum]|uniref:Ion-translocating oxidoreductase complex subunit D n=1 Tax=Natronospirillum operosum TaxID=2759953 RepID=A0A4Z0WE71_9GAMM|nr:electron transport complex subunit RsxD [Natronospirillum operosum]TGG95320.1 electron transport complex subunit RsxD [Natronospirillum operosum]
MLTPSSPHAVGNQSVQQVMFSVWAATLPGFAALIWFFGWGYLINAVLAVATALVAEAIILRLRRRPVWFFLGDGSALLTAWLLALALPPLAPWWIPVIGTLAAIVFAKHLYGGLGNNPFNPAMVGYAVLLISFPVEMTTRWGIPAALATEAHSLLDSARVIFAGLRVDPALVDGMTMATPLDVYKNDIATLDAAELRAEPLFSAGWRVYGWEWVSGLYLLGGLYLLWRRIITWHIPVAVLGSLTLLALLFSWNPDLRVPVDLHLLGGATMLGAFFIATDPVSAATSNRGKLVFGAGIGILIYVIRTWGNYPDAVAFAVLLMNFAAPLIDHYTRPRVYGEGRS